MTSGLERPPYAERMKSLLNEDAEVNDLFPYSGPWGSLRAVGCVCSL